VISRGFFWGHFQAQWLQLNDFYLMYCHLSFAVENHFIGLIVSLLYQLVHF
jgi:hypothetical protein